MSPISLAWCWYLQIFSSPRGTVPCEAMKLQRWGEGGHTHHWAWPLMGCWAGNYIPELHLHTLKPHLVRLIWDTVLGSTVPLGSPPPVLCSTGPLVNRQSYCVRSRPLETFQVSELKAGVMWGNFSWLMNPRSCPSGKQHTSPMTWSAAS